MPEAPSVWETFPRRAPGEAFAWHTAAELDAMTLGTLSVETDTPDAWYCPGKDCPVLEFSVEFKLYGNPAPQAACCPCCGTKATHIGWRRTVSVCKRSCPSCPGPRPCRTSERPSSSPSPPPAGMPSLQYSGFDGYSSSRSARAV